MVDVAQLVELRIVTPAVEGSNPFVHPIFPFPFYDAPCFGRRDDCSARVAKLVDAPDLGSGSERSGSSILPPSTISTIFPFNFWIRPHKESSRFVGDGDKPPFLRVG